MRQNKLCEKSLIDNLLRIKYIFLDEEESFCRWNEIQDYDASRHAPERAKYMEMPPLMKLVVARNLKAKKQNINDDNFLLPAYKTYDNDVRLTDTVESCKISQYLAPEFKKQIEEHRIKTIYF